MQEHHKPFTWFDLIPGLEHIDNHIVTAYFIGILLVICGIAATVKLKAVKDPLIPEDKVTFRNLFEIIAEKLYQFCESIMGEHDAKTYFPVVATLFMFVFASNIVGLVPGFLPPTDNINTTLAAGLFVFLYYNFQGLRANGFGYIKHFFGPVWWLGPLIFVIEIASHLFRPLTLAIRLRANIYADHVVLHVFTGLTPYVVPVIFYGMGVFVSFIQAFVFCLLTMVYISLATAHDH